MGWPLAVAFYAWRLVTEELLCNNNSSMVQAFSAEQPLMDEPPIERALAVVNMHSSNAKRMLREIGQLSIPTQIILTSRDPRYTQDEVLTNARQGDVILSAGGDGTANENLNIVLSPEAQELGLHLLPFVPLRGGNANDSAYMLNGRRSAAEILQRGQHASFRPLEIQTDDPELPVRRALGYFSALASAAATHRMGEIKNTSNHITRATRIQLARETVETWRTIAGHGVHLLHHADQDPTGVTDYLVLRGDRIAKLGKAHADLRQPVFEVVATPTTGPVRTMIDMLKMLRGRLYGEMRDNTTFRVETADGEPFVVQYDGEHQELASGTTVTVRIADTPYRTLTTRF